MAGPRSVPPRECTLPITPRQDACLTNSQGDDPTPGGDRSPGSADWTIVRLGTRDSAKHSKLRPCGEFSGSFGAKPWVRSALARLVAGRRFARKIDLFRERATNDRIVKDRGETTSYEGPPLGICHAIRRTLELGGGIGWTVGRRPSGVYSGALQGVQPGFPGASRRIRRSVAFLVGGCSWQRNCSRLRSDSSRSSSV